MLATLQNRFPLFMKDICKTFGNFSNENGKRVCTLPSYITPEVIKYCNNTQSPSCNEFITKIPTWFLSNHCQNRHRMVSTSKEDTLYERF